MSSSRGTSSSSSSSSSADSNIWSSVPVTAVKEELRIPDDAELQIFMPPEPQSFTRKLWEKTKKEPFVPIGFLATCACLGLGVYNMSTGNKHRQQLLMRGRVAAQAFTLCAFGYGLYAVTSARPGVSAQQMARENEARRTKEHQENA